MRLEIFFKSLVMAGLFCAGSVRAEDGAVAARYHYAGIEALSGNADLVTLHKVFKLTNSPKFRSTVITSLSDLLPKALDLDAKTDATLLNPLLDDLGRVESAGGFGGVAKGPLEFVLAVHLESARAELWKKNLGLMLAGKSEWRVTPAGDWLVVSRGTNLAAVETTYLQAVQKNHRAVAVLKTNWFEADVDWVGMGPWLGLTNGPLKLPRTVVSIATMGDNFRTTARVIYPESIETPLEPWNFPKMSVKDPLISFTAARNVLPLVNIGASLAPFIQGPLSHQVAVWALGDMAMQTYATTPMVEPTNVVRTIYSNMPAAFNEALAAKREGAMRWETNGPTVVWTGLGMFAPYVRPLHEKGGGDFVLLGLFPLPPRGKPAPQGLWDEITKQDKLVYYDWETTALRLQHWRLLSQMLPILPHTYRAPIGTTPTTNSVALARSRERAAVAARENWLEELGTLLGESVTQVTRTGPNELSFLRKSQAGFTSFELVLISHWLSGTGIGPFNQQLLPPRAKASNAP